jgi:hypothetical protein
MGAPNLLAGTRESLAAAQRGAAFLDSLHAETLAKRAASYGKLPAYGRRLMQLRQQGLVPDPPEIIVCLDSWKWARGRARVVVAYDQEPGDLDLSFVAGLDVRVVYRPWITFTGRRDALIRNLVRCGPTRLYVHDQDNPRNDFWVISQLVGLERQEYAT